MCVAADTVVGNCHLEMETEPVRRGHVPIIGLVTEQRITSWKVIWNDAEHYGQRAVENAWAVGETWVSPAALGPLRPPAKALGPFEDVLLTEAQGLQSRMPGQGLFSIGDDLLGSTGDDATRFLWTIDDRGVNVAFEQTPMLTRRGHIVHSNISSQAHIAGEAWFVSQTEVAINFDSGRWGMWTKEFTQAMAEAAVSVWESLGYVVTVVSQ
jgi:hypothetical protein